MAHGPLFIPDRSYQELGGIARQFLGERHPSGEIPLPIEDIIELQLELNIIPTPGLRRHFDIDGYVSKGLRDISVDQYIQDSRPDHYRYVLAHELAHVLIHGDVVAQLHFDSIESWKAVILGVGKEERSVYDGQAHELGTLLLVPPDSLGVEFAQARKLFEAKGLALHQVVATERGRLIIEDHLARRFVVPRFVITDRMNRDRLLAALTGE